MVSPDDFGWVPGQEPIPVLVDPLLSQRFVMLDSRFAFGDGKDSFQGYGVGRTFPVTTHGRTQLLAGAVGNLTEGFGKFKGLEGTYMLNGSITPAFGFLGNITLRVVDWDGKLRTDSEIRPLEQISDPNPGVTYILLHGQKKDQYQKTAYIFGTGGSVLGLDTPAQWRSAQYSFTDRGYRGLRSNRSVFEIVGALDAKIYTNLLAPPGTADAPALFTTQELYTFVDRDGRTVGTITAGVAEGESFNLTFPAAPGQPGLRFGGFGPIQGGTGPFVGVQGMLTVNSLIGISPHVLSLMHVLRIIDPDGRFRAGFNGT